MDDLQRDLFYRGLRVYRWISAYVRVSAQIPRYIPYDRLNLVEKTSLSLPTMSNSRKEPRGVVHARTSVGSVRSLADWCALIQMSTSS